MPDIARTPSRSLATAGNFFYKYEHTDPYVRVIYESLLKHAIKRPRGRQNRPSSIGSTGRIRQRFCVFNAGFNYFTSLINIVPRKNHRSFPNDIIMKFFLSSKGTRNKPRRRYFILIKRRERKKKTEYFELTIRKMFSF